MLIRKRLRDKAMKLQSLAQGVSHRNRLAVLYLLAHGSKETFELADHLMIKEPLLIHHLQIMVKSGWLKRMKTGRHVTYALKEDCTIELKKFLGDTPFFRSVFPKDHL